MNRKLKIAVVGAGNAGCITALYYSLFKDEFEKVTIYYDPEAPIEKVGQGTTLSVLRLLEFGLDLNWYNQFDKIKATRKDGILYENWGKKTQKFFHKFPFNNCSCHYVPHLLSKLVLESGLFNVIEKKITDPEKEIDSDIIFDCRGRHNRDPKLYYDLINPLNSVILSRKEIPDLSMHYTRCVATPHGWTFVIPNHDGVSYGYLFNNKITSVIESENSFRDMFDVNPGECLHFENYTAKNCFVGKRTILNGNRLAFLEPLEATSTGLYQATCRIYHEYFRNYRNKENTNIEVLKEMKRIETFVLWHYQYGSVYDTPFWEYAKSLTFIPDDEFNKKIDLSKKYDKLQADADTDHYSQWAASSFRCWIDNVVV